MSDHTPIPYFPSNLDDYAPWVTKYGLRYPYGECQCGCGTAVAIASESNRTKGWLRHEPKRFVSGHNPGKSRSEKNGRKECSRCGKEKDLSKFYRNPKGQYKASCIACYRDAWRTRYSDPAKRQALNERARQRRKLNWRRVVEIKRTTVARNPKRESARRAVVYRVRCGIIPPAWSMVCEYCQEAQAAHWHHHKGYSSEFALDVVATCVGCHVEAHFPHDKEAG